jgi:hypothetical protein
MFSALLTPLRARFEVAPPVEAITTPTIDNVVDIPPEDFAVAYIQCPEQGKYLEVHANLRRNNSQ